MTEQAYPGAENERQFAAIIKRLDLQHIAYGREEVIEQGRGACPRCKSRDGFQLSLCSDPERGHVIKINCHACGTQGGLWEHLEERGYLRFEADPKVLEQLDRLETYYRYHDAFKEVWRKGTGMSVLEVLLFPVSTSWTVSSD
jgi:hypothetical protein